MNTNRMWVKSRAIRSTPEKYIKGHFVKAMYMEAGTIVWGACSVKKYTPMLGWHFQTSTMSGTKE